MMRLFATALVLGSALVGCAGSSEPIYNIDLVTAKGKVLIGNQPASGVEVTFTPVVGKETKDEARPAFAVTDDAGEFELVSPPAGAPSPDPGKFKGILPGQYAVSFHKYVLPDGSPFNIAEAKMGPQAAGAKDLIPDQFGNPQSTPHKVNIPGVGNDKLTFELPAPPK